MSLEILGIGTAMPQHSIAQNEAAELAKIFFSQADANAKVLPALYKRTQIKRRGSVILEEANALGQRQFFFSPAAASTDYGPSTKLRMERYAQEAAPLALAAAQKAMNESKLYAGQISHLITVSCTGFFSPGVDIRLIKQLGLSNTVSRTHIGFMGCHAALNGLRGASAMTEADLHARVLLCAVELCSLHLRYGWDAEKLLANALFADGAAALVAAPAAQQPGQAWQVAASGSCLFPDSEEAMAWRIGDNGFEMSLSSTIPALLATHLRAWLEDWLKQHKVTLNQIRSWAIHPGGPRILNAVAASLSLADQAIAPSREVLAECGNMSSPTLLFILERLRAANAPRPCVALGFGPGLIAEAALLI